jgi:hypothetical protein
MARIKGLLLLIEGFPWSHLMSYTHSRLLLVPLAQNGRWQGFPWSHLLVWNDSKLAPGPTSAHRALELPDYVEVPAIAPDGPMLSACIPKNEHNPDCLVSRTRRAPCKSYTSGRWKPASARWCRHDHRGPLQRPVRCRAWSGQARAGNRPTRRDPDERGRRPIRAKWGCCGEVHQARRTPDGERGMPWV